MALRHNITNDPVALAFARQQIRRLRDTLFDGEPEDEHFIARTYKLGDRTIRVRIAGENEFAYLKQESLMEEALRWDATAKEWIVTLPGAFGGKLESSDGTFHTLPHSAAILPSTFAIDKYFSRPFHFVNDPIGIIEVALDDGTKIPSVGMVAEQYPGPYDAPGWNWYLMRGDGLTPLVVLWIVYFNPLLGHIFGEKNFKVLVNPLMARREI